MKLWLAALALVALPALAQVRVESAWTRATPPGAKVAAGYFTVRNQGASPDRLLGVSSGAARKVETHMTVHEGGIARMREVQGYEVPANGALELKPGGAHLMFVDIKAPFRQGERVPALLRFEKAGEVKVELEVRALGAPAHDHSHKGH